MGRERRSGPMASAQEGRGVDGARVGLLAKSRVKYRVKRRETGEGGSFQSLRWHMVAVVVQVMFLATMLSSCAQARPCPANSFFVFSVHHNASHCACSRDTKCIGSECTTGMLHCSLFTSETGWETIAKACRGRKA